MISFGVLIRPRPTPRPRGKKGQGAYYPPEYNAYRDELLWRIRQAVKGRPRLAEPLKITVSITLEGFEVQIEPGPVRPKGMRGDIENFVKGLLDGLQQAGVVEDDRWVHELNVRFG